MLKLLHSFGSLILTGLVFGGLFTIPAATTPPQNAPLTVQDVIFLVLTDFVAVGFSNVLRHYSRYF